MKHKHVHNTDTSKRITKSYTPHLSIPDLRIIGQLMFDYLSNFNKYRFTGLQGRYVIHLVGSGGGAFSYM